MFPFIVTCLICAASDSIDLARYRSKTLTVMYIVFMAVIPIGAVLFFHNIHAESFAHSALSMFGVEP